MDGTNSRMSAYLGISLTPQTPAILHSEVEKTVKGQTSTVQQFATAYFATQADLEVDSSVISLTKDHQVVLLSHIIKNLRGQASTADMAAYSETEKQMIVSSGKIAAHATNKIVVKTDASNVEKEKVALSNELQSHLDMIENPVQNYLSATTSTTEPALHLEKATGKVRQGPMSPGKKQEQIELQSHLIAVLRGEIPMCSLSKWAPHLRESIQASQAMASQAMGAIGSQSNMTLEKMETEQRKLADKLESDMLANGLASQAEITTARKGLLEAAPPDVMANKITNIAQKYIDTNPLEKAVIDTLQPGQVIKLSRKLVKGAEGLPKSVYIFRQAPNGPIQMVVKFHKTATSTVQDKREARVKADSSEVMKAELGKGASNVAKRAVDASGKVHVQKENIADDTNAKYENRNERNALARYGAVSPQETSHILLPTAQGRVAAGEKAEVKGAFKEVKSFIYPFAEGGELKKILADSDSFVPLRTNKEMKKLMQDVATGVSQIHALKLAHRDLKPENVLIHNGVAKVSDHGNTLDPQNAAHNAKVSPSYDPLKQAVPYGGTVLYMAPETLATRYHKELEAEFSKISDPAEKASQAIENNQLVDLWSLGMILFQMMNTPTTDSSNFKGGPSLLQKECMSRTESYAMGELIPKFDPTHEKYEADFAQFRQNCEGRFSNDLIEAVIGCFTVDPKERRDSVISKVSVDPDEGQNLTAASAILQLIKAELK